MSGNRWSGALIAVVVTLGFGMSARPACAEVTVEEALGAASAVALYDAQMVLGLSADAFAKKVYDAKMMKQLITEQTNLLANLDKNFAALLKEESVSADDKKALKKLSECVAKLTETAEALQDYVDESSEDNANAYQEKRKASYAAIAELMGLDKDK